MMRQIPTLVKQTAGTTGLRDVNSCYVRFLFEALQRAANDFAYVLRSRPPSSFKPLSNLVCRRVGLSHRLTPLPVHPEKTRRLTRHQASYLLATQH